MPKSERSRNSEAKGRNVLAIAEIAARLKEAVESAGGPSDVSARSGVPLRSLGNYMSGISMKADAAAKLAAATDVTLEWLLTGRGERRAIAGAFRDLERRGHIRRVSPNSVEVPFYKDLKPAAGGGAVIDQEASELVVFDRTWLERSFGVPVRDLIMLDAIGESMEPLIHAGDPLLVNAGTSGKALGEGIFVIRHESALLVKRLQPLPGHRLRATSANEAYQPFELQLNDEALDFAIIGRVICVCRRM